MNRRKPPPTIRVRASINLAGIAVGQIARVDPHDAFIEECINEGYLTPLDPVPPKPEDVDGNAR